jgi:high-affinity nickel-transport protein
MLLGLLVGLRHAFEPDHLTAMATLVGETRDARRGAMLGAIWGVGHTISLVVVGLVLIAVGEALPTRLAVVFELAVAVVLVVLGVRTILHRHDGPAAHVHISRATLAWRPLAVGLVHGLAGSGALTAIVFAQLPSTTSRIAYISLFGLGSVAGMAAASAVTGASLGAVPGRTQRTLLVGAGVLSIVLGIAWSVPLYAQLA